MKNTLLLAALLVAVSAFAAKEPEDFGGGYKGFTKPHMDTNIKLNKVLTFEDVGPKSCITFTELPEDSNIQLVICNSDIKVKCLKGMIYRISCKKPGATIKAKTAVVKNRLVFSDGGYAKSVNIATCGGGIWAGENPKGAVIKVEGTIDGSLQGCVKSISANYFDNLNLESCSTPKILKVVAKQKEGGVVNVKTKGLKVSGKNVEVKDWVN